MKIKGFSFNSLKLNLEHGRGSNVSLPSSISSIVAVVGSTSSPAFGPFNSFYCNELPRLFKANKNIQFKTLEDPASDCKLQVLYGPKKIEITLNECTQASQIYEKLLKSLETENP
jgi:hypothetical protein